MSDELAASGARGGGKKEQGTRRDRVGAKWLSPRSVEAGVSEPMLDLTELETRPHVAHLLGVPLTALVGAHVDDDDPAARSECTVHILQDERRIDNVVQDQSEDSDVELAVRDR